MHLYLVLRQKRSLCLKNTSVPLSYCRKWHAVFDLSMIQTETFPVFAVFKLHFIIHLFSSTLKLSNYPKEEQSIDRGPAGVFNTNVAWKMTVMHLDLLISALVCVWFEMRKLVKLFQSQKESCSIKGHILNIEVMQLIDIVPWNI